MRRLAAPSHSRVENLGWSRLQADSRERRCRLVTPFSVVALRATGGHRSLPYDDTPTGYCPSSINAPPVNGYSRHSSTNPAFTGFSTIYLTVSSKSLPPRIPWS